MINGLKKLDPSVGENSEQKRLGGAWTEPSGLIYGFGKPVNRTRAKPVSQTQGFGRSTDGSNPGVLEIHGPKGSGDPRKS